MKRRIIRLGALIVFFVLTLAGCAAREGLPLSQRVRVACFADTEYGYYYLDYVQGDILYRLSNSDDALVPLCQKPGCDHSGGDFREVELSSGKAETIPCPVEDASLAGQYFSDDLIVVTQYPDLFTPFEDREEGFDPWGRIEYSFFSGQYQLLDTLSVTDGQQFEFATKDRLYFRNPSRPELYWLDRAAVGSGKLEPRLMGRIGA